MENQQVMTVEIWSDVMCPFCYIGKRKFEMALAGFADRDRVAIEWKSFQLDPSLQTDPTKSTIEHLAEAKGWTLAYAQQMTNHVTELAKEVGLTYNFDKAITANSFDAHRFSHIAKHQGVQDEAEERLFAAYFTEGKNTADLDTLVRLGTDIGLDADEVRQALESDAYADAVRRDIHEARQLGVQGVPFFVFNRKFAVSGAQDSQVFTGALQRAFADWRASQPQLIELADADGPACTPDGECR